LEINLEWTQWREGFFRSAQLPLPNRAIGYSGPASNLNDGVPQRTRKKKKGSKKKKKRLQAQSLT
jgi:hypothetical protein